VSIGRADIAPSWHLDREAAVLLTQGRLPDPFAVLGRHPIPDGWVIRAFVPGAKGVDVLEKSSGKTLCPLSLGAVDGLLRREILASAANEATLEPIPDKKGVMCSPAGPVFDQKAAEQTAKATGTSPMDWGFPVKGSLDVHAAGQAGSPVIEKVGSVLVRVMPEGPPPGAGDAPPPKPGASFVRVVTPSGKVGYVVDDAIGALDSDQLCFVKDAAGWHISGYAGGDN
jgi:hypothetical protein